MRLYLLRHGESSGNAGMVHSGWSAVELTEKGRAQAAALGEMLRGVQFDKVYSSDLLRAVETQKLALPGVEAERLALLREIHVGSLAGRTRTACIEAYGESYLENVCHSNYRPYGGENNVDITLRARQFLTLTESCGAERVAAFTHAGVIRRVFNTVLGVEQPGIQIAVENCSAAVFAFEDGVWKLVKWNVTPEL